ERENGTTQPKVELSKDVKGKVAAEQKKGGPLEAGKKKQETDVERKKTPEDTAKKQTGPDKIVPKVGPGDALRPEVVNTLGMKLALTRPGKFLMGSPAGEPGRRDDELQHEVALTRPYYMGASPVTQDQYEKIMNGDNPSLHDKSNGGGPNYPVESVKWDEAVEF